METSQVERSFVIVIAGFVFIGYPKRQFAWKQCPSDLNVGVHAQSPSEVCP